MRNQNLFHRAIAAVERAAVIACCAVIFCTPAARAQWPPQALSPSGRSMPEAPTVTVATLRVPQAAWRHFDKAKSAGEHNRLEEFQRETAKALEIAPEFAEVRLLRAKQLGLAHKFAEEVDEVIAARRADPGVMWAGVMLAGAYNGMRRFNDARLVLDAEHGMEADSWQAIYERARAETGLRHVEAGLRWSGIALRDAPVEFVDVHLVRANALMLAQRWSEAKSQMQAYLESKSPENHRDDVLAMQKMVTTKIEAGGR